MKRLYMLFFSMFAALFLTVGVSGCRVEVDDDGPVEEVVEELDD